MENNKYLDCPKNIYIISSVSYALSLKSALHFFQLQKQLENVGFTIVNPIEIFITKKEISYTYDVRNKLKKLINCDWVYIMPDVSLQKGSNTEVRISLELDMKIIHGDILNVGLEELV
ncbi:DUF4406 domain-containing protein [Flavobacterium sp. GB2R13]|uniref:DUF4406 domain-containing protein n=1 Tax=Flavobacterium algoris TaxID=3398733 RepID=UPI003A8473BC